jgi:hypothetical protein
MGTVTARVIAAIVVTLPLLAGCSASPVAPSHAVADIEGTWTSTRTLTSTTLANDGLKVGDTVVRNVVISAVTCDAKGACTGTITSSAADASIAPASSSLAFDGDKLSYGFDPEVTDCTLTDGTLVSAKAYSLTVDYDLAVSKGDAGSVSEFTGTSGNTVTTSDAATTAGCPAGGDREFDVVLQRAP